MLPVLAGKLPLPIPEPVALGRPAAGFPWPWSVYRWIEGEPACLGQVADLAAFAADLAGFLAALYAIDASGGPPPGWHSAFRGGPLTTFGEQARTSIHLLAEDIDARAAIGVWETALASPWQRPPVWLHGDVSASNLLLTGGALHAVIDFGCAAVGDPACDLVMAWTFFSGEAAAVFRRGLPFDEATWIRAAAGRCGKRSSPSAAKNKAVMVARPQPAGSAGATAHARSSAASSPTTPGRAGTESAVLRRAGYRDGEAPPGCGLPRPTGSDLLADERPQQHKRLATQSEPPRSVARGC